MIFLQWSQLRLLWWEEEGKKQMFIYRNMDFTERLGSLKAFLFVCFAANQIKFFLFAFTHVWKPIGANRMRIKGSVVTQAKAERSTSTYLRVSRAPPLVAAIFMRPR